MTPLNKAKEQVKQADQYKILFYHHLNEFTNKYSQTLLDFKAGTACSCKICLRGAAADGKFIPVEYTKELQPHLNRIRHKLSYVIDTNVGSLRAGGYFTKLEHELINIEGGLAEVAAQLVCLAILYEGTGDTIHKLQASNQFLEGDIFEDISGSFYEAAEQLLEAGAPYVRALSCITQEKGIAASPLFRSLKDHVLCCELRDGNISSTVSRVLGYAGDNHTFNMWVELLYCAAHSEMSTPYE